METGHVWKSIKLELGFPATTLMMRPMGLSLDPYNLLAGFIFGTLGWGSFSYGRKLDLWKPRAIGLALMIYPYFITNNWLLWGAGVGLLVLLWFHHDE
jgi:hypothetical protein